MTRNGSFCVVFLCTNINEKVKFGKQRGRKEEEEENKLKEICVLSCLLIRWIPGIVVLMFTFKNRISDEVRIS